MFLKRTDNDHLCACYRNLKCVISKFARRETSRQQFEGQGGDSYLRNLNHKYKISLNHDSRIFSACAASLKENNTAGVFSPLLIPCEFFMYLTFGKNKNW